MLFAGADHVYPIIIVYQPIVRLFPCGLRGISIRYLPAVLPIKGWISLHNHVTYAHNSGMRRRIYLWKISSFHTLFSINELLLLHFCKWRNGHVAVYDLCFFFIVSINELLFLHFYKWRTGIEPCVTYVFFHCLH